MSASGDDLGPACWICHDHALAIEAGAHSAGPLLRACACRGPDASFSHLACLVEYAQHAGANRATSQGTSWSQCPTCKQDYTGELQLGLARARWELVSGRGGEDAERCAAADDLAMALQDARDFEGALPLFVEVLAVERSTHGDDHPVTLTSIGNIASLHNAMGNHDLALPLYIEALAKSRRLLGDEDPDTLTSIGHLATAHIGMDNLDLALPLCEEALAGRRRVMGSMHPDTLNSVHTLAVLRCGMSENATATTLMREALVGYRRVLGDDHPHTQVSMAAMEVMEYNLCICPSAAEAASWRDMFRPWATDEEKEEDESHWMENADITSPLGMLVVHGSLPLVTDLVHADDALCLALTCRTLRDALWARFPGNGTYHPHVLAVVGLGARVDADGVLNLSKSDLRALPEGFGRLAYLPHPGLRMLDLHGNGELATLPADALDMLDSLELLDISRCPSLVLEHAINTHQGGLPMLLAYLRGEAVVGVEEVYLTYCDLTALPEGFGRLAGLRRLNLSHNRRLAALPADLSALMGLEELNLKDCGLTALPEGIGQLTGLRKLILNSNSKLDTLPVGLFTLAQLEELHLSSCGLTALSADIERLARLRKLDLSFNGELTLLPEELCALVGLEVLDLHGCGLTTLPEGIGRLAGLTEPTHFWPA